MPCFHLLTIYFFVLFSIFVKVRNWFSNQRSKDKKLVKQELPEAVTIQPKVMCMMIGFGFASLISFELFDFLES